MVGKSIFAILAGLALCTPGIVKAEEFSAAPPSRPISIGTSHSLDFAPGDTREINVYLPDGYAEGEADFPVLYLIDGGLEQDFLHVAGTVALNALWGRSQSAIVVGIQTKDRRAELIGEPGNAEEREQFPTAGQASQFRAFIREKVKPFVEATYRTNGFDAVMGESLAGLFIAETWLKEPGLFDRYAAVDPSLWWKDVAMAKSAEETVADGEKRGSILLSYANEGTETKAGVGLIAEAAGENGCVLAREDLTHATAYHVLTPQVLQFLLPTDYEFDAEWGFTVDCAD